MARASRLILNRYEPIGTAGVGGFGTVQIAWDPRIQRRVAIKTIPLTELDAYRANLPGAQAVSTTETAERWRGVVPWNEYLENEDRAGAFPPDGYGVAESADFSDPDEVISLSHLPGLDEARTAAMLQDPRIVTVYDFEVRERTAYLIMEYVEGITLTRLLSDYADFLTLDMVAAVFDAVAGALMVAHKAGVLHLDIKPDNIIINPQGQAKVTDFGLATLADASGAGTTGGGTIGYMPLEQMRREHLDARTDEWSLASVAYEMLTGDNPFRVSGLDQAEAAIENAELVLPSLCWEDLDEQIDDVMFYALDPDREDRYASVAHFAEEMDKFLGDTPTGREQLALVVADALGLGDEGDEVDEDGADAEEEAADGKRAGFFGRLFNWRGGDSADDYDYDVPDNRARAYDDSEEEWEDRSRRRRSSLPPDETVVQAAPHIPLSDRVGGRLSMVLSRVCSAAGSGFVGWLALANMPVIPTAFGAGTGFMIAVVAAVLAAIGAIIPHIGALASLVVLGIAIVACGHPFVGLALMVAVVVWWLLVGKEGIAPANVSLSLPLLGSIGGNSAVPFLSGAVLPLPIALMTTLLVAVEAIVLASLGSTSLLGWDVFANWDFTHVNITANVLTLLKQVSTWATIAGWLVATAALSLCRMRNKRWLTILGLALAMSFVLVGSLLFAAPSPQLIASTVLAVVALFVAFV